MQVIERERERQLISGKKRKTTRKKKEERSEKEAGKTYCRGQETEVVRSKEDRRQRNKGRKVKR